MSKKGYWMAMIDVQDLDIYKTYIETNGAAFAKYGAKFLVRAGRHTEPEGPTGNRHVIIEFESYRDGARLLQFAGISRSTEASAGRIGRQGRHRRGGIDDPFSGNRPEGRQVRSPEAWRHGYGHRLQ